MTKFNNAAKLIISQKTKTSYTRRFHRMPLWWDTYSLHKRKHSGIASLPPLCLSRSLTYPLSLCFSQLSLLLLILLTHPPNLRVLYVLSHNPFFLDCVSIKCCQVAPDWINDLQNGVEQSWSWAFSISQQRKKDFIYRATTSIQQSCCCCFSCKVRCIFNSHGTLLT